VSGFSNGAVINRFAYTPYGDSQTLTASWGTPAAGSSPATPWQHLFQGLKFSDVTGLAYVRARDYSATLGRFIELDPIGFDAGDNNWYRFVGNGPTGNVDPSGLVPWHETVGPTLGPIPDYSNHEKLLGQLERWTYSKHSITFTVNTRMSDKEVLDDVFKMLENFSYFNSGDATVRKAGTTMYFDLSEKQWGGWLSDRVGNDDEVGVHLAKPGPYELQGTTFGKHQLIGVRKWRVFLDPNAQVCGQNSVTIETEADERPRGVANSIGAKTQFGRAAQISIWKGYLERTAAAASRKFGSTGDVGAAALPNPPSESPCPRRNRFAP